MLLEQNAQVLLVRMFIFDLKYCPYRKKEKGYLNVVYLKGDRKPALIKCM